MDERINQWRRDIEEAIQESDQIHLNIVLDRIFCEIEDAILCDCDFELEE